MTVREFLLRVRKQNYMLLIYEQELTNLQAHASNISSPAFGDKVQGNHISSLDEIVEKIVMQADKVNRLWDAYIANKERAASMIGRIDDDAQKAVLYRYYIMGENWKTVSCQMHYTRRYIFKLHDMGIKELSGIFKRVH